MLETFPPMHAARRGGGGGGGEGDREEDTEMCRGPGKCSAG